MLGTPLTCNEYFYLKVGSLIPFAVLVGHEEMTALESCNTMKGYAAECGDCSSAHAQSLPFSVQVSGRDGLRIGRARSPYRSKQMPDDCNNSATSCKSQRHYILSSQAEEQ